MKKYSFSKKHWLVIVICFVLFLLANAVTSDAENVILPKLAEANGWDYSLVLTLATVAGCSSVAGSLILGKLCEKMGGKFAIIFGLVASSIFVFIYGTSSSLLIFVIGLFGTICCGQSISFFGANSVVANWFPTKKGLAMGIISIGPPAATIIMVSVLNAIIAKAGIKGGIYTLCGVCILVAVICGLLVHNTPEEVGETPDNLPVENKLNAEELNSTTTVSKLLKTKAFWMVTAICGICSMSQTGLMAQWLVRYTSNGYTEAKAAFMMSICAVAGIFGSMIAGNIENRLGTKKGYVVLALWFMAALILNFTNITSLVYLSVPMFGLSITLYQIFMPAFEISVFGRENFKVVNGILFPLVSMCGQ
nr:MFS transporter [Pseudobutyrivibrio sp.]